MVWFYFKAWLTALWWEAVCRPDLYWWRTGQTWGEREIKNAIHRMFQVYHEGIKTTPSVCTAAIKAVCIFHGPHKNGNDLKTENTQLCQINVKICQCKHSFRNGAFWLCLAVLVWLEVGVGKLPSDTSLTRWAKPGESAQSLTPSSTSDARSPTPEARVANRCCFWGSCQTLNSRWR